MNQHSLLSVSRKLRDLCGRYLKHNCACEPRRRPRTMPIPHLHSRLNLLRAGFPIRDRTRLFCSVVALLALSLNSCGGGSASPSRVPINTATGWSDSPFISGDGKRLYFMYSRWNFGPWIQSAGAMPPVLTGPDRPGLNHNDTNAFDESDIYVATRNPDGRWSEPVNLGLNGAYGDASGMEINGGNTFIWLQGNGTVNNIVMANRNMDGTWGPASDLGPLINNHLTGVIQDNPHLSADGSALWFTSNRAAGLGGKDIWFSSHSGGSWSSPVNAGPPIDTAGDEDQFWFSPASLDLYWNGPTGLMHCISNGSSCSGTPDVVTIPGCTIAAEVSITDDGKTMYFGCGDPATGRVRIMYSQKQPGGWGTATPVD